MTDVTLAPTAFERIVEYLIFFESNMYIQCDGASETIPVLIRERFEEGLQIQPCGVERLDELVGRGATMTGRFGDRFVRVPGRVEIPKSSEDWHFLWTDRSPVISESVSEDRVDESGSAIVGSHDHRSGASPAEYASSAAPGCRVVPLRISGAQPMAITAQDSSGAGKHVIGIVTEVSPSELVFSTSACASKWVAGALVELTLEFAPEEPLAVHLAVEAVTLTRGGDGVISCRVSGRLRYRSPAPFLRLNGLYQRLKDARVVDATVADHDELWRFLFESGFVYRDKRVQLQGRARDLCETSERLLRASPSDVHKTILFKQDGVIRGTLSFLRMFDSSWVAQHLSSIKTMRVSPAQHVLSAAIDLFFDAATNRDIGLRYFILFYRPTNTYSMTMFSEVRYLIGDPEICDAAELDFCLLDTGASSDVQAKLSPMRAEIRTSTANTAEVTEFCRLLEASGRRRMIAVEDLTEQRLTDLHVTKDFERIGLYRFRRLFVASGPCGKAYALCNFASPGINLSELTNSFRIFLPDEDIAVKDQRALVHTLALRVLAAYARTRVTCPVLLAEQGEWIPAFFRRAKRYQYWTMNTMHMPLFKEAFLEVQGSLKQRLPKYAANVQPRLSVERR